MHHILLYEEIVQDSPVLVCQALASFQHWIFLYCIAVVPSHLLLLHQQLERPSAPDSLALLSPLLVAMIMKRNKARSYTKILCNSNNNIRRYQSRNRAVCRDFTLIQNVGKVRFDRSYKGHDLP